MKLLNLVEMIKEKIMARPKGIKNKAVVAREEVAPPAVEFNYENDDVKFDSTYQMAPQGYRADPASFVNQQFLQESVAPSGITNEARLFLVEGEVQLSSRAPGKGAMIAKQMRLVQANSDDEAIQKYVNYFTALSDQQSVYMVISAAAMETIS